MDFSKWSRHTYGLTHCTEQVALQVHAVLSPYASKVSPNKVWLYMCSWIFRNRPSIHWEIAASHNEACSRSTEINIWRRVGINGRQSRSNKQMYQHVMRFNNIWNSWNIPPVGEPGTRFSSLMCRFACFVSERYGEKWVESHIRIALWPGVLKLQPWC